MYLTDILSAKNGADTELLIYTMTLINKVLYTSLPYKSCFCAYVEKNLNTSDLRLCPPRL